MQKSAKYWIKKLELTEHPEGGYYKEVYRDDEVIKNEHLPSHFKGNRNYSTAIYFLLDGNDFSAFHKIKSDEIWHFYAGTSLIIYVIDKDGNIKKNVLGNNPEKKEELMAVIPKESWFAAKVIDNNSFSLIGCTVAPGFHFDDFELGNRENMIRQYPEYSSLIIELTRNHKITQ
ncbi:MAG: cupin domain-containing protein [Bacteroidetes bacterium]|jgi:predicted cupin superfamily sugar epimerase|nr:cupin domain-containing protein [Bacteroidota bacterium]